MELSRDLVRLVEEYHAPLYRYAYRLTGSTADAEDLTQQVFLIAHQKLAQLRDQQSAQSWLFTVLRRCFLKQCRQHVPTPASSLELQIDYVPDEAGDDPIDREQLQRALDGLPEDFKLVLMLFYYENCSYREIAEKLELPIGTVMSRLSRAKGALRRRLAPQEVQPNAASSKSPQAERK